MKLALKRVQNTVFAGGETVSALETIAGSMGSVSELIEESNTIFSQAQENIEEYK